MPTAILRGDVYQEVCRGNGSRVQVDGPVHESLAATDRKDNAIHIVDGNRFNDHGFGAHAPIGTHKRFLLPSGWLCVRSLGVLRCKA